MAGHDGGLENLEEIERGGVAVAESRVVEAVVCDGGVEVCRRLQGVQVFHHRCREGGGG